MSSTIHVFSDSCLTIKTIAFFKLKSIWFFFHFIFQFYLLIELIYIFVLLRSFWHFSFTTLEKSRIAGDDEEDVNELGPPLTTQEIKNGQWLGVTVRSQRNSGKVSFLRINIIFFKLLAEWHNNSIWSILISGVSLCTSIYCKNGRITTWPRTLLCAHQWSQIWRNIWTVQRS